jgi:hypothetical protein
MACVDWHWRWWIWIELILNTGLDAPLKEEYATESSRRPPQRHLRPSRWATCIRTKLS